MCTRGEIVPNSLTATEPTFIMQEKASFTGELSQTSSQDFNEKALFYETKAIQKIVREGILLAGGPVAILPQVANPGVGQGVNEHSNFAYRPVDRLRTTMTYVYSMTFGTPAEKKAIIEMTHRAHAPIQGPGCDANDPELQLWVAATLYASGIDIYEKFFGKLDDAIAEKVFREYAVLATFLRVPPEMWPANRKAFWAYWDAKIESFEISPHAQNVALDLLRDNKGPFYVKMNLPFLRLLPAE